VLLDEIEKAHADVFNILLQVLDDGRLTDGHGKTVDFRNTVVIMTSNIGSQWISELQPGQDEEIRDRVMGELKGHFRPEFLNRVDEVIIFHQLTREHIGQIVDLQFNLLKKRLAERRIEVSLTPAARDLLAEEGYDPAFGARPLKRAIQRLVLDPLAMRVLGGEFKDGDRLSVNAKDGKLMIAAE